MTTHSSMTLEHAAAICHAPVSAVRTPKGCEGCQHCSGYSETYEALPKCVDCGDLVCDACMVPGSLVTDHPRSECQCKSCQEQDVAREHNADADTELAELYREDK